MRNRLFIEIQTCFSRPLFTDVGSLRQRLPRLTLVGLIFVFLLLPTVSYSASALRDASAFGGGMCYAELAVDTAALAPPVRSFVVGMPPERIELLNPQTAQPSRIQRQQAIKTNAVSASDLVRSHLARGDLARAQEAPGDLPIRAMAEYEAALQAVTPEILPSLRLEVEGRLFNALIKLGALSSSKTLMALDTLLQTLEEPTATPKEQRLAVLVRRVRSRSLLARVADAMVNGVAFEQSQNWAAAEKAYQEAAQFAASAQSGGGNGETSSPPSRPWLPAFAQEAARSIPLMTVLAASPPQASATCTFLGVDHTPGSGWYGTLGTEGWVLFAPHGDDLCGGPRVLDHSFSYHAYLGDPTNGVRRWRDPVGPVRFPGSDLLLSDPAAPGEGVVSYLDDNGEEYPVGAGPDLYAELTIPAGHHLLSLPLHFDLKAPEAHYGLYLLAGNATAETSSPSCLAAGIVSTHDEPGIARFALFGPAHYTLLMRRLSSENANLPALLLDPDQAQIDPAPLSSAFTLEELAAAGLSATDDHSKYDQHKLAGPVDTHPSVLQTAMRQYEQGHLAPDGWADLASRATQLAGFSGLDAGQQTMAAWLAWQAQDRAPLQCGHAVALFRRFLDKRFPLTGDKANYTPPVHPEAQISALKVLSVQMRAAGRLALAEAADDAAWDRQAVLPLSAENATSGAMTRASQLWDAGPRPYLTAQTTWLWQGESAAPPHPVMLAIDAEYVSRKAQRLIHYLLTNDPKTLSAEGAIGQLEGSALTFDDPKAQQVRLWLDQQAQGFKISLGSEASLSAAGGATDSNVSQSVVGESGGQPVGAILYAAACEAIKTGQTTSADETGASELAGTSLLRPDQIELLARCYLNRDLFATPRQEADRQAAAVLLQSLKVRYPKYPRLEQVTTLLASLPQATVTAGN